MNAQDSTKRFSLPIVPFSFLSLVLVCSGLYWWFAMPGDDVVPPPRGWFGAPPPELIPFRTEGGTLHTDGFLKTESFEKHTGSWIGTTSSGIRLNATYRYEIDLRSKDWYIYLDESRSVAFVIAPPFRPQLPVAVDSKTVYKWTSAG